MTFREARGIFLSYPELEEKAVSGNRYRYHVKQSLQRGKEVARELTCNNDGLFNGYINSRYMSPNIKEKYKSHIDTRQMIMIRNFSQDQLHEAIQDAIQSMTNKKAIKLPDNTTNKDHSSSTIITEKSPEQTSLDSLVRSCLYNWLGYGNPNSPLWFIGTEEGGAEIWRQKAKTFEESLTIRSRFTLHMDFQDVWEDQYNIPLTSFRGASVWNFIAAFLLKLDGTEANSTTIRDFVFNQKQLGRATANHYLCELFPLPKTSKNEITPYENIWSSIYSYRNEVKVKRLELIKKTLEKNPFVKIVIIYEQSLVELLRQSLADSMKQINNWNYRNQKYSLFKIKLSFNRTILLLSTPFFGQGQISYDGIQDCVDRIKIYL